MLKQRVITAVILLGVLFLAVTASSPWPFLLFLALACACAGWEWLRLTSPPFSAYPIFGAIGLFALTLWQIIQWTGGKPSYPLMLKYVVPAAVVLWVLVMLPTLWRAQVHVTVNKVLNGTAALVTLFATWSALGFWYLDRGATYVISLLVLVWIADIAAYFVGRALGRTKLAPTVSPGKTLEGACAGVVGVEIWLLVSAAWPQTFAASLLALWSWWGLVLFGAFLACFSITGDLFESLLKRRAGVKDSSQLLPGHGGVYDRIDAVVAVVPLAFLLIEYRRW